MCNYMIIKSFVWDVNVNYTDLIITQYKHVSGYNTITHIYV
jgi:hypothetical protein